MQEFLEAGVPPDQVRAWREEMDAGEVDGSRFSLFPCNWDAVMIFQRVAGFGFWYRVGWEARPVNLNDTTVINVMRMMGREPDLELFDQVMTIGAAAAEALRS